MLEHQGLKTIGQQTTKLTSELKELITIVTELEKRIQEKLTEIDNKMKTYEVMINDIING